MIDRDSDAGSWATAMAPTHPSLRVLSQAELHDVKLTERIFASHGCKTQGEARDLISAEISRRLRETVWILAK